MNMAEESRRLLLVDDGSCSLVATALILDKWLGKKVVHFYKEHELTEVMDIHMKAPANDINEVEGRGALNFLHLDHMIISEEGEQVYPNSIMTLPFRDHLLTFPIFKNHQEDPFLLRIQ